MSTPGDQLTSPRSRRNVTFHVAESANEEANEEAPIPLAEMNSPPEFPPFCLTKEDVFAAFDFFDVNGTGALTMASLKQQLSAFYPDLTSKEYRFLLEDPIAASSSATAPPSRGGGGTASATGPSVTRTSHSANAATTTAAAAATAAATTSGGGGPNSPGNGGRSISGALSPGNASLSNNNNNNNAGGGGGGATSGFTAAHLWEMIDTYQKLYMGPDAPIPVSYYNSSCSGTIQAALGASSSAGVGAAMAEAASSPMATGSAEYGNSSSATKLFDPIQEAFRVYDPTGRKRCVDLNILAQLMARIGYGDLSPAEMALLVKTADFDGDGVISLDDFRRLVHAKGRMVNNAKNE